MPGKFSQKKKCQSSWEYFLLIGLVISGLLTMQVYTKRAMQSRLRSQADTYLGPQINPGGGSIDTGRKPQFAKLNPAIKETEEGFEYFDFIEGWIGSSRHEIEVNLIEEKVFTSKKEGVFSAYQSQGFTFPELSEIDLKIDVPRHRDEPIWN